MNLLIIGGGKAGSWAIRGQQIGAALGARVTSDPQRADFDWADVILLVKRAILQFGMTAQATGKPFIWDALDFWRQPDQNGMPESQAVQWFSNHVRGLAPAAVIGATEAMAKAIGGVYIPHHAWPGLQPTPARRDVQFIGYEGNEAYLGRWRNVFSAACNAVGWRFVVNPPDLSQVDMLVAVRDDPWDGWVCREWKSGVKVVNAIAAGRPLIGQRSAARLELPCPGAVVESPEELPAALAYWADYDRRAEVVEQCAAVAPRFTVDAISDWYRKVLEGVLCPA